MHLPHFSREEKQAEIGEKQENTRKYVHKHVIKHTHTHTQNKFIKKCESQSGSRAEKKRANVRIKKSMCLNGPSHSVCVGVCVCDGESVTVRCLCDNVRQQKDVNV